jgi:hypothetical protein
MAHVNDSDPGVEALVAMRPDWTGTGGYGGLAGLAVDSTASLEDAADEFESTMYSLTRLSLVTRRSNPAQGIATFTPPYMLQTSLMNMNDGKPAPEAPYGAAWPEFFDESDFPPFWPQTERAVQNAVAAIVDSFIRSVFGFRPDWTSNSSSSVSVQNMLWRPDVPRGTFRGSLVLLQTAAGCVNLSSGPMGVNWTWC